MRNFFLKLITFVALLLTLQAAVSAIRPPKLPQEILALDQYLQADVDLIYLGDSILIYPAGEPTIPEMLQGLLPNHTMGAVAHPAYQPDLYERYVNYLVKHKSQVKTVIIPINMRSFSPEWDLRPTYQFEREKIILTYGPFLSTLFYQLFATFGLFDSPISQAEFQAATVFSGDLPAGKVAEFEELIGDRDTQAETNPTEFDYHAGLPSENEVEALKGTLVYYYMFSLDSRHRKLESLRVIGRLLQTNGITPIFYITPINYQLGEQYLGQTFRERLTENTAVVAQILDEEGVDVLNLVFELEAYNFVDTEHLTENGKAYVAEALAAVIKPAQPDPLTSTSHNDAPLPQLSAIEPPDPTPTPRLTPTPVEAKARPRVSDPTASPGPAAAPTIAATETPRSLAQRNAGQLVSTEFWTTFEPVGNYAIDVYHLRYKTVARNEQVTEVEARLFVPQVTEPTDFPVLVYGPGTTGLNDECAPLNEGTYSGYWGGYHTTMLEYTAQGLIGVLPNYQGFDDRNQPHPYFIAEFQGRALLDAAQAAYNFFAESPQVVARPMEAVFFAGYSSGGHAAFAAKDFAATYAPELPVKGIIGHGATTNIETLLREDALFTPYIVQAYRDFYGPKIVEPAAIFQERWLSGFEASVMTRCVDDIYTYFSPSARQMYQPRFMEALFTNRLQTVTPAFKAALESNKAGLSRDGATTPVLILQGTADQVVTPPSQIQFAAQLCRLGNHVTYRSYPAIDHSDIRLASFRDTINWIEGVATGELPESNCASLTDQ